MTRKPYEVEKSGSSSWHKVFWMLRSPNALFEPSKAYALNYDAMKKIKPEMWSQALNDPTWIRNVFELMLTSVSFYWLPHRRKYYVGIEHQFENPYKICHGTSSPSTTILRKHYHSKSIFKL